MSDNVFKFRRLKWGDPAERLKMLPEQPRRAPWPWIEIVLGAIIAASAVIIVSHMVR